MHIYFRYILSDFSMRIMISTEFCHIFMFLGGKDFMIACGTEKEMKRTGKSRIKFLHGRVELDMVVRVEHGLLHPARACTLA